MAIKLPERNYFTFPEIMTRWQCAENDIRHIVISGALRPSHFVGRDLEYRELKPGGGGSLEAVEVHDEIRFFNEGFYYLHIGNLISPFECEFGCFTKSRDMPEIKGGELKGLYLMEKPLPLSHVLEHGVVTIEELVYVEREFSSQGEGVNSTKEPSTRERNTLLAIIAALCKEAKIDYSKPAKAAGLIRGVAAGMGVNIGESTIEGHLKKIPDALESRMK